MVKMVEICFDSRFDRFGCRDLIGCGFVGVVEFVCNIVDQVFVKGGRGGLVRVVIEDILEYLVIVGVGFSFSFVRNFYDFFGMVVFDWVVVWQLDKIIVGYVLVVVN